MMTRRVVEWTALAALAGMTFGCASMGKTEKGAAVGAGAGGALGALIGHATGSTARGALIGAVVGGAAGAVIGRRMDRQAEELTKVLPDAQVSRVGEGIAVTFDSGILFPFDSAELQGTGEDNLRRLADQLRAEGRTDVLIVGHTDSVGADDYNQTLSERRARTAASYLSRQGISSSRVRTEGRGEREPIAANDDDEGRRRNRRVELAIYANEAWREDAQRQSGTD